jgi:site-specific DNA-methyltransferase (adenine-specific)
VTRKEVLAEGVELWLGDCLEVLPTLGKFAAVVTDPPYGMGDLIRKGGKAKWSVVGEKGTAWDDEAADLSAILALSVPTIIWGGQFFPLPLRRGWLVWDKLMEEFSTSVCELAWTNLNFPVKRFRYGSAMVQQEGRVHPTQKPVALMKWCLGFVPDGTTFDPYMGSGTTGVAAVKLGRRFTGVEIDPGYFDIACRRIDAALKEPDMFIAPPKPAEQLSILGGAA